MEMREEIESYTTVGEDQRFAEIRAPFMLEAMEDADEEAGMLDFISFRFERFTDIIIPLKTSYVAVTVENDLSADAYTKIARQIRTLTESASQPVRDLETSWLEET